MLGSSTNQDPRASANLVAKAEFNSVQSCAFATYNSYWMQSPGDGNYFTVPSLVQSGKNFDYRDLQLHLDKVTFSSISSDKLETETRNGDQTREHHRNLSEDSQKKGNFSSIVMRKRRASAMRDSSDSTSRVGESIELIKSDLIKEDQDCGAMQVGDVDVDQDIDTNSSTDDSIPIGNLIPEDVVKAMGQRLFQQARRTMVDQQRIFSVQIFELHRLIKVQRLISQSPQLFHKKKISEKPSLPFPLIPKLLYKSPPDQLPAVAKPKVNGPKSNPREDRRPKENIALPLSIPSAAYIPSLIFHPPPVNQWLVPIRSPSEGLVYKPIAGPCFPNPGFMGPSFGDHGTISLSNFGGTACSLNLELDNDTPGQSLCRVPSQQSAVICDGPGQVESNLDGPVMENESDERRVQVIKVVPHSRKFAPASAARIFQSIQEERRKG